MWHLFCLKVFPKTLSITLIGLLLNSVALGQEINESPGLIETVQTLIKIQQEQFVKLKEEVSRNPRLLSDLKEAEKIKLDPYFARSLLFYSESKYLDLMDQNECQFYALLENRLLKHAQGEVDSVFVTLENSDGEKESAQVGLENFLQLIYKNKCSQNRDLTTLFNNTNIKRTVNSQNFQTPQGTKDCENIIEGWQRNPYTPYICRVSEALKEGLAARSQLARTERSQLSLRRRLNESIRLQEFYQDEIPSFQRTYIHNLCENLGEPEKFCSVYLANDVWNQILNGEHETWKMSYKCRNILNKDKIEQNDLRGCALDFNDSPQICRLQGNEELPAIFPHYRCDTYSETLKVSKLRTNYHDCPARLENEAIVNTSRLMAHFDQNLKKPTHAQTCTSQPLINFVEMNVAYENSEAWPMSLCYKDRVSDKEVCENYVPGFHQENPLAENHVVSKILMKNYGVRKNTKCKLIDDDEYNPLRLEYKTGCYITYQEDRCSSLSCPKKIYYDQKEIKGITSKGAPLFDYFPNSFNNEKFAISNILNESLRLESKAIRNLTELTHFLNNVEGGVAHGIGCAEDLLPQFFKRQDLNQCNPLPFIIDGVQKGENAMTLSVRPAVADLHSPMSIHWNHLYTSIVHYQEIHPSKSWMLYGLNR